MAEFLAPFAGDQADELAGRLIGRWSILGFLQDFFAVAVLLASKAGAGITGAQISVDGGTAQY